MTSKQVTSPVVTVYDPQIKVTLFKTIGRKTLDGKTPVSERYTGLTPEIDLTPWLSEAGGLRTMKGRGEPAGTYVRLKRGSSDALYYVVAVSHEFRPFSAFITMLTLERDMGFVERVRKGAPNSPYLSDLKGAVDG